jgi:hypothetical protein
MRKRWEAAKTGKWAPSIEIKSVAHAPGNREMLLSMLDRLLAARWMHEAVAGDDANMQSSTADDGVHLICDKPCESSYLSRLVGNEQQF